MPITIRTIIQSLALLLSCSTNAQNVYDVTGGLEICLCWDEPFENQAYTFYTSAIGSVVGIHFCDAQLDPNDNLLLWEGMVGGIPASPATLTGTFTGLTVYSANNILSLSLTLNNAPPGFPVCGDGVTSPWRLVAYSLVDGTEEPPPCTGTGLLCPTVGVNNLGNATAEWIRLAGEQLVLDDRFHGSTINLFDPSGRLAAELPTQGRSSVTLPSTLPNGTYAARAVWNRRPLTARFVLLR